MLLTQGTKHLDMEIKDPVAFVKEHLNASLGPSASEVAQGKRIFLGQRTIESIGVQLFQQDFNKYLAANGCGCVFPLGIVTY